MNTFLECSVYTTASLTVSELRKAVSVFVKATLIKDSSFQVAPTFEISIRKNDEYNQVLQKSFPDGFLNFRFIIDIGFNENNNLNDCVKMINKLLQWFWENNISAVASYDHEDLLVKNGGYKSKLIPWPE
ncbi:hypothetical protein BH11BAC6_BH11BAC6_03190 [soil metagenome]